MTPPTPPQIPLRWAGTADPGLFDYVEFTATVDLHDGTEDNAAEWIGITKDGRAYLVRFDPHGDRYELWQIGPTLDEHGREAAGKAPTGTEE